MSVPRKQAGSILVVDDDATFRNVLARSLTARGYAVWVAANYFAYLTKPTDTDELVAALARERCT